MKIVKLQEPSQLLAAISLFIWAAMSAVTQTLNWALQ